MAKHSWPSRRRIFYRVWISEHDLGSGLDRKGDVWRSFDHEPISDYCSLHSTMESLRLLPESQSAYFLALWSFMVSSLVDS